MKESKEPSIPTIVIDGNSIAWRAEHAADEPLTDHEGNRTEMIYVFLRMLRQVFSVHPQVKRAIVCWDSGEPKFRLKIFPDYKSKRFQKRSNEPLDDLAKERAELRKQFYVQQGLLKLMLPLFGIAQIEIPNWEADDLVAFCSRIVFAKDEVLAYSGDRDAWQLINERVNVLYPNVKHPTQGASRITLENFHEFGKGTTSPLQWLIFRVLTGDDSDGIPGIGGVGAKRGLELSEHGYAWRDFAREKYGEKWLEERLHLATRNLKLMNLELAVNHLLEEIAEDHKIINLRAPNRGSLKPAMEVLEKMRMFSLTRSWPDWSAPFRALVRV